MSFRLTSKTLTRFADVHYYFSPPTPRPLSHRFDKGSYLYLHQNSSRDGGRLEIANNVGKPEQDAFTGCEQDFLTVLEICLLGFGLIRFQLWTQLRFNNLTNIPLW